MLYKRAGYYIKQWDETISLHGYSTFTPTPVCDININVDDEMCGLLSNAHRLLGLLEGSCRYINNIENVNSLMLKKEAAASCKVDDDINISHLDLFIQPKNRPDRILPIQNYMKALSFGIAELKRIRLTNKVIFSTHKMLMEHKNDTEIIGNARKKQIFIGNYLVNSSGMETYNPPSPEEINLCITDIQRFIRRDDGIDLLVKAALIHYQMEVVHPFESGNGKIGRVLILMYLFDKKILNHMLLPISEFLEHDKVEYFDRIRAVHNFGKYEQWIKFFLQMLAVTADTMLRRLDNVLQLRDKNITAIKADCGKDINYLLDAYQYLEKHIFLNTASLGEAIGISYNTASRVVKKLVEMNILKLVKDQARNKVYFYFDFLRILEFEV